MLTSPGGAVTAFAITRRVAITEFTKSEARSARLTRAPHCIMTR
jgi:hypothetical protein